MADTGEEQQGQAAEEKGQTRAPAPPPAQEWGERTEYGRSIASGGKESEKAPGSEEQKP